MSEGPDLVPGPRSPRPGDAPHGDEAHSDAAHGDAPDTDDRPTAEALMAQVALGSAEAFEQLYPVLAPPTYGLALRVLRDPGMAQDVTQEVLVDVWRLAPRYERSRGSVLSWTMTMAHRRSVDRVRREQSQAERSARAARSASVEADRDVVVGELERSWDAALVRRGLASLTGLQRQAIELAYFRGYTHTEVAAVLGIPLGTAKTRIRDGLIRLRDTLGVESA